MKRVTSLIFMMLMLFIVWTTNAQVSTYTFASSSGTFTPITGGTLLGSETSDDQRFVDPAVPAGGTTTTGVGLPIGFSFVFDGVPYDRFAVNNNGWISLGQSSLTPSVNNASTSGYTPISSTTVITPDLLVSRIAGMAGDLQAQVGATLRFETIGTTPNSTLVIQWLNYKRYGSTGTGDSYSFQIRLHETTNVVEFVYGTVVNNATAGALQVGLRGAPSATATNFFNRTTTTDWSATTPGGTATASCTISTTVFPASGLTFAFTPAPATAPGIPNNPSPGNLASNVSITPTLTWTFGLNTLTYDLYFGTDNPPLTKVVNNAAAGATGSYIPGTLSYNTPYYWYVVAKNNADLETVGPLWSFSTQCETVNAPFVETFDIWPPNCWSLTGGTHSWVQYALDPVYCAKANYWSQTSGSTDVMTTPPINIAGLAAPNLKFDWSHLYSSTYPLDALTVLVSDNGGSTFTEVWYKAGADLNSNDGAGNTAPGTFVSSGNIDLSGFGDVVLVKFYGYSGYGPDLFVDNVTVYEPAFGTLAGNVTSATSKGPIEGALITAGDYSTTTDQFGDYIIPDMAVGTYDVTCEAEGYFALTASGVVIGINQTITLDFVLGFAQITVNPTSLSETLLPDATATQTLTISNPNGTNPLNWSASIQNLEPERSNLQVLRQNQPRTNPLADESDPNPSNYKPEATDAMFDLLGSFPVHDVGGTYSVATDGNFLYTGRWNLNQYDKYALDGTWIESFSIPGAGLTRDLAYDGQYFYGSPNSAVIYQMDFNTKTLVSTITATGNQVRGIAYDPDTDGFWVTAASFTGPFRRIDRTGATVQTVTPAFGGISGLAYDNVTPGGPYLWAYTPASSTNTHIIIQVDMTGATVQQFDLAAFGITAAATVSGGLEISDGAVPGKWAIMGVSQNDIAWLLELADAQAWLTLDTYNGVVNPGESQTVNVNFDAAGLVDSTYLANININHNGQEVTDGTVTVPVSLTVASTIPPVAPTLIYPAAAATLIPLQPEFLWTNGAGTAQVQIEIKRGSGGFSVTVHKSAWFVGESYDLADHGITLLKKQLYTWIVRAKNAAGTVSSTRTFTTIGAGTVGGVVTDAYFNTPLVGAEVTIPATGQTATTAADGSYTIANVLEGTYDVTATFEGYTGQTQSATVVHNQLALVNFALNEVLDPAVGLTATVEDFINVNLQWHEPGYVPPVSGTIFEDNFDSYIAGQQLACQNPDDWTTWTNAPCGAEDAYISSLYSHSGPNSAVIAPNNDLVKDFGEPFTSGKYSISFWAYIPTGGTGYFNTLQAFVPAGTSIWGIEVFFNAAGAGSINATGTATAAFTWTPDTWFKVEHIVDLNSDYSEIWIGGNMIYSYQWSLGATGTGQNTLDANDFYGAAATDQMFIDDYKLYDMAGGVAEWLYYHDGTFENGLCSTAGGAGLAQVFTPASYPCTIQEVMYFNDSYGSYSQQNEVYILTGDGAAILGGPYYVSNGPAADWVTVDIADVTINAGTFMVATYNTLAGGPYVGVDDSFYDGSLYFGSLGAFTELGVWGYYYVGSHQALVSYGAKSGTIADNSELLKPAQNTSNSSSMISMAPSNSSTKSRSGNRALLGYNLYKNNELLAYTTELTYNDLGLASGTYDYTVTAVYEQGESDPIGPASVDVLLPPVLISAEADYYGVDLMWQSNVSDKIVKEGYSTSDILKIKYKEPSTRVYDPNKYPRNPKQGGETIADAFVIGALPFYEQGTTEGYLNDYDEACPYTGSTAPEVVYSFTPAEDLLLTISLCESLFDTKLYVYENEYTPGNAYACNDDYVDCPEYQSQLSDLFVQAGNTYYIVVDAYGADYGTYIIDITGEPYVPCVVECPAGGIAEGEECATDGYVDNFNGGCNSIPVVYSPIASGDVICGTSSTYVTDGASRRDTDWYELVLNAPKTITWTVDAEFPVYAFIIDGNLGCEGLTIIAQGAGAPCETAVATTTVPPGTYWLWVGPQVFTGLTCGNSNDYVAELTLEDAFLTYFDVFRNGTDIADVYGNTYRDEAIVNGETYCYTVAEHVSPDLVTPESNELCATVPLIPAIGVNPLVLTETHITPPAYTTTQTVTVTNTALGTLDWNLEVVMNDVAKGSKAYCDASTTNQDECIGNVTCGTINNTTGWQGGVGDYTAMSTTIEAGAAEPITVTSGCNIWASDVVTCWVDWDMSETWDQLTNEEFILTNVGAAGVTYTGAIAVPEDVPTGSYRMRVRMTYSTAPVPCGVASYGEVEDYTINVLAGAQWLTADVLAGSLGAGQSANIDVTFNSEELSFGTYTGALNFWSNDPVTPELSVPVTFTVQSNLGTLTGLVTDPLAKTPVEGVSILVDEVRGYSTTTLADGTYTIDVPEGLYTITAQKAGYITSSVSGVMITSGQTTVQNFQLEFAAPVITNADPDFFGVMVEWEANPAVPGYPYKGATAAYSLSNVEEKPALSKEERLHGPTVVVPMENKSRATGDDCSDPIIIGGFPYTDVNTTCGRGNTYSETCLGSYDGGEDIVYSFTTTEEKTLVITLTTSDTWTGMLLTQECPIGANCVNFITGSSGNKTLNVTVAAGTYYLMLDTWPTPDCISQFTLNIAEPGAPQPGETCELAVPAVEGLNSAPQSPFWYEFTSAQNKVVTISSCMEGQAVDTRLYVYDACDGIEVAYNDDLYEGCEYYNYASAVSFNAIAGVNYKIYWDPYWETTPFDFTIELSDLCQVECPVGAIDEGELCGEDTNGGCNMEIPAFTPISCGDVICGTAWADGTNRDTDWYELVLDAPKTITWSVTAEFPVTAYIIDGNYGCDGLSVVGIGQGVTCETAIATATLAPGIYWLWVGDQSWSNINPCGDNNTYVAELTCEDAFITYFNLYRDGDAIAQLYQSYYYDQNVEQGETYCYTVDQVLQPGLVTGISNEMCATVPIPPVIVVNPEALTEVHSTPQTVTTQEVTVSNNSLGDLEWNLSINLEAKVNLEQTASSSGQGTPAFTSLMRSELPQMTSEPVRIGNLPSQTDNTFWSQMTPSEADGACASQEFEAGFEAYFCRGADDFTVTTGPWNVGIVSFVGAYWNGTGPALGFNIEFFNDEAGLPGTPLQAYSVLPYTSVASGTGFIFTVALPEPLVLENGNYWIAIQARMDFAAGGQFGLIPQVPPQIQYERMWINPGNGFGGGAITWTPGSTIWPTQVGRDWCFQLESATATPWLTADLSSGSVGAFGSTNITVTFNSAELTEGTYNGSLVFTSNDPVTPSVIVPVTLYVGMPMQEVALPMGWSAWSSFINPDAKMSMEDLMAPVVDNMIITQYFNQLYYPMYNINTLGEFSNEHGYITKMMEDEALTMMGTMADPTVSLTAGWNLFPVLQSCPIAAADVFSNMAGFIIAYEIGGIGIWYPAGVVYTLTDLVPGKAYWVKVAGAVDYTFPGCLTKGGVANVLPLRPENKTNWNDVSYTGLSHAVIFNENATSELLRGDVIGAFTSNGTCAGLVEVANTSAGFVMFGDDITTTAADGFTEGETLSYKLFRQATGEEFTIDVTYSTQVPNYDGKFVINGLSVVSDLTLKSTGISTVDLGNLSIYPNPSTGIFNVVINDLDKDINYTIVNAQGQEVVTGKLLASQQIDLSTQPKGVYFIKFTNETVLRIEKLVVKQNLLIIHK